MWWSFSQQPQHAATCSSAGQHISACVWGWFVCFSLFFFFFLLWTVSGRQGIFLSGLYQQCKTQHKHTRTGSKTRKCTAATVEWLWTFQPVFPTSSAARDYLLKAKYCTDSRDSLDQKNLPLSCVGPDVNNEHLPFKPTTVPVQLQVFFSLVSNQPWIQYVLSCLLISREAENGPYITPTPIDTNRPTKLY